MASSMSIVGSSNGSGGNCGASQLSEKDKGSRNKRKFRADPPPSLPLIPCTECNANGNSNKGFVALRGWKMGYPSGDGNVNGNSSAKQNHNHNHNQNHNHHHHHHQPSCYASNGFCTSCTTHHEQQNSCKCGVLLSATKGIQLDNREIGYGYEDFCSDKGLYEEREEDDFQDVDWHAHSESQLEELLLNNLDMIYKSAIRKIVASGYTEEIALKAVLKHGKCYGNKDTVSNIVDNALAHLSNNHDVASKELYFEDLQQLEKYILSEMVSLLRGIPPLLSTGDAMWCLLHCDMNVSHACAMDEDALSNYSKDSMPSNSHIVSPLQCNLELSSSSVAPAINTNMPAFNDVSTTHSVPQNPQMVNSSMPFVTGVPAFPNQGFPMPGNKVQNACKHDHISASDISEKMQSGLVQPCCTTIDSKFSCNLHLGAVLSSDPFQSASAFTTSLATESRPRHHTSEVTAEDCALSMAQPFQKAEKNLYETHKMKNNLNYNSACLKGNSEILVSSSGSANKVDQVVTREECLLKMSQIEENPCFECSDTSRRAISSSCITCLGDNEVQQNSQKFSDLQTTLLIGKSNHTAEPQLSMRSCRMDPETVDEGSSFSVAGAELSLSLASSRDQIGVDSDSMSVAEEAADSNFDGVSLDQIFGGNGSQDRKDEMIMKMFHRVRELETQLQEWTEWAQQKVMQAARRLSKEKAELKTLRKEKEEAIRLKKEKQSLEESTMKKLSEMENALRKAGGQVERANAAVRRLEEENAQVRHEMEVAKLRAADSAATCQEVSEREKKTLKKFQAWERQKASLQEELASEKRKLAMLQNQLLKAKEWQQQIEVRWKQEEKAKEEAILRAAAERRSKEQIEAAAKKKEETLQQKAETDSQRWRDNVQRLEHEIAQLRLTTESSKLAAMQWGSNCNVALSPSDTDNIQVLKQTNARLLSEIAEFRDVQRDRECVMCLCEEMSVVFLPCAHQVVCTKCNELHEKQGMKDCPSCRTPIKQRVCVYSANS